jgi:hypothetical protein
MASADFSAGQRNYDSKLGSIMSAVVNGIINGCLRSLSQAATKPLLPLLSAVALAGCSIHPVQRDVTGIKTVDIVDRIRCETRVAIQDKAIQLLRGLQDQASSDLADYLDTNRGVFLTFDPRTLPPGRQREFYYRYIRTGVAYDFTFDITEDNRAIAAVDPVKLITNGTVGIGLNGTSAFNRNNSRHFVMSDTFENLLRNPKLPCEGGRSPANYAYPIAGSIGMFELLDTFVDLNEDKQLTDTGNSRVFADTLTFLTTLTGSVSPHIELSPVGNRWGLSNTSVLAGASRIDKHMLIIGLSMDPVKSVVRQAAAAPGVGFLGPLRQRSALQKSTSVSPAEQRALDAVSQQRLDTFYDRFGTSVFR